MTNVSADNNAVKLSSLLKILSESVEKQEKIWGFEDLKNIAIFMSKRCHNHLIKYAKS